MRTITSMHARLDELLRHARKRGDLIARSLDVTALSESSLEFVGLKQVDLLHSTAAEISQLRATVQALDRLQRSASDSALAPSPPEARSALAP